MWSGEVARNGEFKCGVVMGGETGGKEILASSMGEEKAQPVASSAGMGTRPLPTGVMKSCRGPGGGR